MRPRKIKSHKILWKRLVITWLLFIAASLFIWYVAFLLPTGWGSVFVLFFWLGAFFLVAHYGRYNEIEYEDPWEDWRVENPWEDPELSSLVNVQGDKAVPRGEAARTQLWGIYDKLMEELEGVRKKELEIQGRIDSVLEILQS